MFHRRNRASVAQTTQKRGIGMRRRVSTGMPPSKRGPGGRTLNLHGEITFRSRAVGYFVPVRNMPQCE